MSGSIEIQAAKIKDVTINLSRTSLSMAYVIQTAKIQPDGTFVFSHVSPGTYVVQAYSTEWDISPKTQVIHFDQRHQTLTKPFKATIS